MALNKVDRKEKKIKEKVLIYCGQINMVIL